MDEQNLQERIERLIQELDSDNCESARNELVNIGEPAVPALGEALKSGDWYIRWKASESLVGIGKAAVPALVEALKDNKVKEEVKEDAAEALGEIGDPSAAPALIRALERAYRPGIPFKKIFGALVKIGKPAVPALVESMKDAGWGAQMSITRALGEIRDNSKTVQELQDFETKLQEGYDQLRKKHRKGDLTEVQIQIARLRMAVARKKNELAEDKGVLLDDKPKPPKKGMYQQMRRIRNG